MKEYIERASVHSIIEQTSTFAFTRGGMHERVDSLPAADVAPVRHGRWILLSKNGSGVCSECNRQDHIDPLATHCRYCGALMDGKENDHEASRC